MPIENLSILQDAIARNAAIVLSLPSAGLLRHYKSRFLEDLGTAFWVEAVPNELPLINELITSKHPAGLSFKSGINKVIFTAPILQFEPAHQINATTTIPAVLVAYPPDLKTMQRRSNFRVIVPAGSELAVKVWRINDRADLKDKPMAAQSVDCSLRDISVGGVGVNFAAAAGADKPKVTETDRLRVEITYGDIQLLMEGKMRIPSATPDKRVVRTGIQFRNLQNDLEGRRAMAELTRIVGALQREEARRHRMGIAAA